MLSTPQNISTSSSPTFANLTLSSLNPGSVLFADSRGLISQDNNNLFWDNTNKRLGIGTTNPAQKLSVVGDIGLSGSDRFIGTTDSYALSLRTNNTDRIYITANGNVGIGTTNPAYKLDVAGETRSTAGFFLNKKIISLTTAPKWLRFAQSVSNSGNNAGIFEIRWTRSGVHSHIIFSAGANFNDPNGINLNLLGGSSYGSQGITQIRLLRKSTYDPMYLEFYAAYGDATYPMIIEVRQLSGYGWNLLDITDGSIPTGYTAHTLSTSNAFAVNEDIKTFTVQKQATLALEQRIQLKN